MYSKIDLFTIFFINFALKLKHLFMTDLNQIKVILVQKKRTGKWLAEQLGKSNCTVSKWCSNVAQPDLHTLEQIARLLEVDKRDLLTPTKFND